MKKILWIGLGMLVAFGLVAAGALTARAVLARQADDVTPAYALWMNGRGPMHDGTRGLLHDYMVKALADKLGLSVEAVESALDAGKRPYDLALENGVAVADIPALLQEVHASALAAAVADGVITQEQADFMLQRMQGRGYGDPANCPMNGQAPRDGTGFRAGHGMRGWRVTTP